MGDQEEKAFLGEESVWGELEQGEKVGRLVQMALLQERGAFWLQSREGGGNDSESWSDPLELSGRIV